jgi:hypothetical protein
VERKKEEGRVGNRSQEEVRKGGCLEGRGEESRV